MKYVGDMTTCVVKFVVILFKILSFDSLQRREERRK
jgi:hypothetical protein